MKTILPLFPAAVLTAMLFASCDAENRSPAEQEKAYSKYSVKADSISAGTYSAPTDANAAGNTVSNADYNSSNYAVTNLDASAANGAVNSTWIGYDAQAKITNNKNFKEVFSSSAARPNALDSTHRFIRTADIKFRVKDVVNSTYSIENITARFGGYVANTHLTSEQTGQYTTRVSEDSSLETMHYMITNKIVLRIPVENLDTTLKSLVPLIDFLDYRNVSTNDISLEVLANMLQQKRQGKYNARLSKDIDEKGKKLNDVQSAEQSVLSSEETADNALIQNLRLDDQVRYSTITLNIYQHETFRQELVKNEKTISSYEPGLGEKLSKAAKGGWHGLRAILVFFVTIWPLWLIGAAVWALVRWLVKNQKRA